MDAQKLLGLIASLEAGDSMSDDDMDTACRALQMVVLVETHRPDALATMAKTLCLDITGMSTREAAAAIVAFRA